MGALSIRRSPDEEERILTQSDSVANDGVSATAYAPRMSVPLPAITALIGNTPLVELRTLSPRPGVRLFAKLEGQNPTGSIKDRVVHRILSRARASGALRPGQPIVEASTGNTGVALSMLGGLFGHPVTVCVPESVYPEIEELLAAFGATIRRVPRQAGIKSALEVANAIAAETGAFMLNQFGSEENAAAHFEGTGAEIVADLAAVGGADVLVAGMGTGGTVTGAGRRLKLANPACRVIGVEPRLGVHVQGLKSLDDGFIPPVLDEGVLDGKIIVGNRHAFAHARRAMLAEGIFGGISSGAVLHAGLRIASRIERGNVVLIFADGGWKYLGTSLWARDDDDEVDTSEDPLDDILWW
jgi:cysteine synthase